MSGVTKAYGKTSVLFGVTLECADGEAVCVAGANAAGKTTLLSVAAGLQTADGGSMESGGGIGYVPQENALLPALSLRDNLSLWYAACKRPRSDLFSADSVETMLGLRPYAKRRVSRLSGGIKKRAAIACALAGNPGCLLMDEPFTALDLQSRADIVKLLCALKSHGRGLLFSSHDPAAIAAVADRVLLLRDGVIAEELLLSGDAAARAARTAELLSRA